MTGVTFLADVGVGESLRWLMPNLKAFWTYDIIKLLPNRRTLRNLIFMARNWNFGLWIASDSPNTLPYSGVLCQTDHFKNLRQPQATNPNSAKYSISLESEVRQYSTKPISISTYPSILLVQRVKAISQGWTYYSLMTINEVEICN
jgi:hypothetical protein